MSEKVNERKPYNKLSRSGKMYRDNEELRKKMIDNTNKRNERLRVLRGFEERKYPDINNPEINIFPRIYKGKKTYNMTALAYLCSVTLQTIINWNRENIMPKPTFVDSGGKRWYSFEYIEMVRETIKIKRKLKTTALKEAFAKNGVEKKICLENGSNVEFK